MSRPHAGRIMTGSHLRMRRPRTRYRRQASNGPAMLKKTTAVPGKKTQSTASSTYRRNRALEGHRRIDIILTPAATAALARLEGAGFSATKAACEAIVAFAKSKGLA